MLDAGALDIGWQEYHEILGKESGDFLERYPELRDAPYEIARAIIMEEQAKKTRNRDLLDNSRTGIKKNIAKRVKRTKIVESKRVAAEAEKVLREGGKNSINIHNPVLDNVRTGSALKEDSLHAFNDIIDNYAGDATKFSLIGGDGVERNLYQIEGSLNGKRGIFEWIVDSDSTKGVTHRRFIENVGITGKPNARP